ncbi:MAG: hypothetical protein ACSW8I_02960 [bacterium]
MKKILLFFAVSLFTFHFSLIHAQCPEALMRYAERYPAAEAKDLYKLVFQDLYGPGHLISDSATAIRYISKELDDMADLRPNDLPFPLYEYTLCDSNFVRVNLVLVKWGVLSIDQLVSAVLRSARGLPTPDQKFVLSHSTAFKAAYDPHYRIIRRDIFEREIKSLTEGLKH